MKFGINPGLLRGRVLKARAQPFDECHFSPEAVDNATVDRFFDMLYEGLELVFLPVEGEEIEMVERRSPSPSPPRYTDEDLLKGQMLATGRWSDVAADIVWGSTRHAGTKGLTAPFHWMIFQSARQSTTPSDCSLFDLFPGESSMYIDNDFSECRKFKKRWWIVDTPMLGICPVCEIVVIQESLGIRATLDATPHEPFKLVSAADEVFRTHMDVDAPGAGDAELDYGGAVGLEEDTDIQMTLSPTSNVWTHSTLVINPNFRRKRYRQWVDLLARNFVKNHQRRQENPSEARRLDESEGDRFPEPEAETDTSDDENDVIVKGRYDGSVTLGVVPSGSEPKVIPLVQVEEGKGLAHPSDLSHIEHVVVVGPFSSGTNAM